MNFIAFPVGATNIFPLANSTAGGQLLSEYNLRARESVATDANIKYFIGQSYTHSMDDFAVYSQKDGYDTTISNTAIQIQPGRALVNGHYVELLSPIVIDLSDANYLANKENLTSLKGDLAVGLRMAYSTYQTLAGSALVENEDDYYEGVQVVILPKSAVKLPKDVPGITQFTQVNMHLLLGTFTFKNGVVSTITQNTDKIRSIEASRIANIDTMLSDKYLGKANLDPNRLYVFSGKSGDGTTLDGRDTWCDTTDSLMVWDSNPRISTVTPSSQAYFSYDSEGDPVLVVPHKQVDGMVNTGGQSVYFQDKVLKLPKANFTEGTAGVVTKEYTNKIKNISEKLDLFYRLPNGKMRQYISILTDREDLPEIPISQDAKWPYSASEYALDLSELKVSLQTLSRRVSDIETSLSDTLRDTVDEYAADYEEANVKPEIDKVAEELGNIRDLINMANERISALEADAENPEIASLATRYRDLDTLVNDLQDSVAELNRTLTSWEAHTKQELRTDINTQVRIRVAAAKTSLNSEIDTWLEDATESLDKALAKVYEELDARSVYTTWTWSPGDYVLVGEDQTVEATVGGRYPSTMYIVGPGQVRAIGYVDKITRVLSTQQGTNSLSYQQAYQAMLREVPQSLAGGIEIASTEVSSETDVSANLWDVSAYKGAPGIDYFVARSRTVNEDDQTETYTSYFFTPTLTDTRLEYLDPIWITGGVPLATETSVGGFYNVPETAYGAGYIHLDDDGYLRLIDYELLLTGVLAYQLGQDYSEGAGLSIEELQSILDENVNDRVAFPNAYHRENAENPNVIHLYLELPESSGTLTIHDIGSRYGTSLFVHISGSATSNTVVNFINCDKIRIDNVISGAPTINLVNCHLFYDAEVLEFTNTISNMTLWYEKYSATDPDLQVDGMTVTLLGRIESTESIDPWDTTYANDNHYSYSLRSLTFGSDGSIINIGMLVGDSTTSNIDEGKSVFATEFNLPQSVGIGYPPSRMTHRIKITGSFVSHYYVASESSYMMKHTEFSAITQKYNRLTAAPEVGGTISFYTDAQLVSAINGVDASTTIDGWDLNTPHFFTGGVIE